MIPIQTDPSWPAGARMGFLEARDLPPLASAPALEARCREVEAELRLRHEGRDRQALAAEPAMAAYGAWYKAFGQTYHVLAQIESVARKGRPVPTRLCAVTVMFLAELRHGVLGAAHDLDRLAGPMRMAVARGGEAYTALGGRPVTAREGDLVLGHESGLVSSVLMGPDQDTPVGPETRNVLYAFYAPPGVPDGLLAAGLEELRLGIRLFAPDAVLETCVLPS
jgi:DNA/RNA-binding domain of Phe-tRNA-synthetase-like protein